MFCSSANPVTAFTMSILSSIYVTHILHIKQRKFLMFFICSREEERRDRAQQIKYKHITSSIHKSEGYFEFIEDKIRKNN